MPDAYKVEGFETSVWKGCTLYHCNRKWEDGARCQYNTGDLSDLKKHVRDPHRMGAEHRKPVAAVSPILSANGSVMVREEVAEEFQGTEFRKE